jgi:hypothetical protein
MISPIKTLSLFLIHSHIVSSIEKQEYSCFLLWNCVADRLLFLLAYMRLRNQVQVGDKAVLAFAKDVR